MFEWKGSNDDVTCYKGRYIMRVEQLDAGKWWYSVYIDGSDGLLEQGTVTSKNRAIGRCEGYFKAIAAVIEIMLHRLKP